jgi:hypothetical protein
MYNELHKYIAWLRIETNFIRIFKRLILEYTFCCTAGLLMVFHCTLCVFNKSHPSKCFSYESISLFWYYIKQIMIVYSCNGKNIFIRWKIVECSIHLGCRLVEWNIPSFTSWKYSYHCIINIHYLYTVQRLFASSYKNRYASVHIWYVLCVLVLCTQENMMFVVLLGVCIHTRQAEK